VRSLLLLLGLVTAAHAQEQSAPAGLERFWSWFSADLRRNEARRLAANQELQALGTPVIGQTSAQLGYQHPRLAAAPLAPAWVQVDLGREQPIEWVALLPAQVDWQTPDRPAHGFPRRFRIDASSDVEFRSFTTVADLTDSDVANPGVAPVALQIGGAKARFIRLTVTKFAIENGQHFFALGELMVISGRRNVALGRPATASATSEFQPRWALAYLFDGRTPLGPPIRRELLPYDGLFSEARERTAFLTCRSISAVRCRCRRSGCIRCTRGLARTFQAFSSQSGC
jgi:hypothetical protein